MADFLGIGAQKAGTTWLFHHLGRHPGVRFPAGKEVHFWDRRGERSVEWWLSLFAGAGDGLRRGEITPAYALLERDRIAEIARVCPDVRLFYSLRNPIERAWSSALMALARAELCEAEASDQWFLDHFHSRGSRARGDYAACLERWWSVFGRAPLQLILFDDIRARPREVLCRLARHLDIDAGFFAALPEPELAAGVFPGPGLPLRPSLVGPLRALYCEPIDALSRLIERDLSHWKVSAAREARE
jgi:hypothetical protein